MLAVVTAVIELAGVAIVVIGFVQVIRSRSWRSTLVGFCGLCLIICGVAATSLWIRPTTQLRLIDAYVTPWWAG
jgi:hypothetical protein